MSGRRKRRWCQYRLRTLLALATVLTPLLDVEAHRARRQARAVAALEAVGAQVAYDHDPYDLTVVRRAKPRWLRNLLGKAGFASVLCVDFRSAEVADEDLRSLEDVPRLRSLLIVGQPVTDRGLAHLRDLKELRNVRLRLPFPLIATWFYPVFPVGRAAREALPRPMSLGSTLIGRPIPSCEILEKDRAARAIGPKAASQSWVRKSVLTRRGDSSWNNSRTRSAVTA